MILSIICFSHYFSGKESLKKWLFNLKFFGSKILHCLFLCQGVRNELKLKNVIVSTPLASHMQEKPITFINVRFKYRSTTLNQLRKVIKEKYAYSIKQEPKKTNICFIEWIIDKIS